MSLINDALKRAKQHQPPPESTEPGGESGAPMRPIEHRPASGSGTSMLIIGLIVLVLFLAGVLFFLAGRSSAQRNPSGESIVATVVPPPISPTSSVPAAAVSSTNSVAAPKPAETPPVVTPPPPTIITQVVVLATNPPVVAAPVLKLQGIFYRPINPSAIINGKTVLVGDKVGDARVLSITQTSVTIVQGGVTNVLSASE